MTELTPERLHELEVWLHARELKAFADQSLSITSESDRIAWVTTQINAYQGLFKKPLVAMKTVSVILYYTDVKQWEIVSYFTHLGHTPKQISKMIGTSPKVVSNALCQEHRPNPKTLQRWLDTYAIENSLSSVQQATQIAQLVVPPRNIGTLLRKPI